MQILLIVGAVALGGVIILELGLRLFFGLGDPPLYIADQEIGYLLAPKQNVKRMGNRIIVNQYSMRSPRISPERPDSTWRIFLLGDSVANGGWWTDQTQTISALIYEQLTPPKQEDFSQVEVLNASANSWGPRNQVAYLQKFGLFEAQVVILLLNTDDLFGIAPTSLPVGRDRNYPEQKPPLALVEVWQRYLTSSQPVPGMEELQKEGGDRVGFNLEAIQGVKNLCEKNQARFILAMTPLLREVGEPGPRDYEIKTRERLAKFTQEQGIEYLDFLPLFKAVESPPSLYRDHIHLSVAGNELVSETLVEKLN